MASKQPGHLVVVGAEECGGGRRRRRQHHGVGRDVQARRRARSSRPAPRVETVGRRREPHVHATRPQAGDERVRRATAMPPSSAQKSGGPSGSGAGTSARKARMRPPRRCAAASRGGNVAAADMSSTEPAWIPPMSGSTSVSTTRRPSLCATRGPMERSPMGPRVSGRGSRASRARPRAPRTPTMPERAVGQKRVGTPSACPSGSRRSRPRAQTDAPRAAIGTSASASPTSRHRSIASVRRPRNPSGPTIDRLGPATSSALQRATEARARPRAA